MRLHIETNKRLQNNELELNAVYILLKCVSGAQHSVHGAHVKTENTIINMSLLRTQMTIFRSVNIKTRCLFVKFNGETVAKKKNAVYCLWKSLTRDSIWDLGGSSLRTVVELPNILEHALAHFNVKYQKISSCLLCTRTIINFAFFSCTLMTSIRWSITYHITTNMVRPMKSEPHSRKNSFLHHNFGFTFVCVCVCVRRVCVGEHQFSVIISRFSRISRNNFLLLSSRDFCSLRKNVLLV